VALVRQATARDLTAGAVVLDLGDLRRQGEALMASARRAAEITLQEAVAQREKLIDGADNIGYQRGYQRGVVEGTQTGVVRGAQEAVAKHSEALTKLNSAWLEALGRFENAREQMLAEAQKDVVRLACMISERIVRRAIALDPSLVQDQVAEVLSMVLRPTRLRLHVHPLDKEIIELAMPALGARFESAKHMELVEDEGVERGSCLARLAESGAEIDARLGTQLDRMVEALLPEPPPTLDRQPGGGAN
jgi:flagellar assembly protein FliH